MVSSPQLPLFLKKLFWDVNFDRLSLEKSRVLILKRILELGDEEAVSWMRQNFGVGEIKSVLSSCREISVRSGHFWSLIYDIPAEEILCLKNLLSGAPKSAWPY